MTREAAQREAHRRNTSPTRAATHRWFVRAAGADGWTLAKVVGLSAGLGGPLKTTTEAKPRPPVPDDPRAAHWQNVGGPWGL